MGGRHWTPSARLITHVHCNTDITKRDFVATKLYIFTHGWPNTEKVEIMADVCKHHFVVVVKEEAVVIFVVV